MPKRKVCSVETAAELEDSRRRDVYDNPPDPSEAKDVNILNTLKWHSWGWSKFDSYSKAGIGKKTFGRSAIKLQQIIFTTQLNNLTS